MDWESGPVGTQTLGRGLAVLEAVAEGNRTLKEVAAAVGLPRSTTHRLASALVRFGYLKPGATEAWLLGPRLISLGFQAHAELDLVSLARPLLQDLARQTQWTVHLGTLTGREVFYVDKIPGPGRLQMASRVGSSLPAQGSGLGKALIACQPRETWASYFCAADVATPYALATPEAFVADLEATLERGYSLDLEEREPGICCLACSVTGADGNAVAAVSVALVATRDRRAELEALAPAVRTTAGRLATALGARS